MSKFTALFLLGLITASAAQAGDKLVWQCTTEGTQIEIYTHEPAQFGKWHEPRFSKDQEVEVVLRNADSAQSGTHLGRVISQKFGPVTKRAPMARYLVQVKGFEQGLNLVLLGIDVFRERQQCEWN